MRGRFVTFEGGEGCGKSTQVKRLASELERRGIRVVLTREPGGTPLAEKVRGILKGENGESGEKGEVVEPPCDRSELLLFLAARAQLVRNVIRPALESGAWVLSDRFSDSTVAYQGYGRGLGIDFIRTANDFACDGLKPDLTLLLDVEPQVSAARMRKREAATNTTADRIELAGDDFHARLRAGFLEMAAQEPNRIKRLDANGTPDEVWEQVWAQVEKLQSCKVERLKGCKSKMLFR